MSVLIANPGVKVPIPASLMLVSSFVASCSLLQIMYGNLPPSRNLWEMASCCLRIKHMEATARQSAGEEWPASKTVAYLSEWLGGWVGRVDWLADSVVHPTIGRSIGRARADGRSPRRSLGREI